MNHAGNEETYLNDLNSIANSSSTETSPISCNYGVNNSSVEVTSPTSYSAGQKNNYAYPANTSLGSNVSFSSYSSPDVSYNS